MRPLKKHATVNTIATRAEKDENKCEITKYIFIFIGPTIDRNVPLNLIQYTIKFYEVNAKKKNIGLTIDKSMSRY